MKHWTVVTMVKWVYCSYHYNLKICHWTILHRQKILGKTSDNTTVHLHFTSWGANIDKITTREAYCFHIHGQIYHQTGCLHPPEGNEYQYGQVYILEGDQVVASRIPENCHSKPETIRQIQNLMETISPYTAVYNHMYQEQMRQLGTAKTVKMIFKCRSDHRWYNEPQHDKVTAIFVGDEGAPFFNRYN